MDERLSERRSEKRRRGSFRKRRANNVMLNTTYIYA
jgi:hypothetical protein